MKKQFKNNIARLLANKVTFVLLCFLLFGVSVFIGKSVWVKGDIQKTYSIVVYDGYSRRILNSTSLDTEGVFSQNGIKIYPEDIVTADLILDPVADYGAGQKIAIKRAPKYYVEVDGSTIEIRSWNPNVSEIILKSKITLGEKDLLSVSKEQNIVPGEKVIITRVKEADIEVFEQVAFETVTKGDPSVPFGTKKITQEGANGKIRKVYRVIYENGVEKRRYLKSTETVSPKVNKVVSTGVITGRANFGYYDGMVTSFYKGMTGKYLLVTNLDNGKQVRVKIIGSGPFNGPIMDMGTEPFREIGGTLSAGFLPRVSVQLVD